MTPQQIKDLQTQLNLQGANLKVDGILGPLTTAAMNKAIAGAVAANPALSHLTAQNSPDAIVNAYISGNWGGVVDVTGQPFSLADQEEAVRKANEALAPGFNEQQAYDTSVAERKLADTRRGVDEYLTDAEDKFIADKQNLDQDAANKGVLFSGGRVQKEKNLKAQYERDQAAKLATAGSTIGSTANDLAYKYGTPAANNPKLSQYYNLPSRTYNANVSRNGVSSNPLLGVYNNSGNYQGTETVKNKAAVQTRAASLLANKANKIVPYGYKNQF